MMRKISLPTTLLLLAASGALAAGEPPRLESERDRTSYSLGYQIGGDLAAGGAELDGEAFLRGLDDGDSGAEPKIGAGEMEKVLKSLKEKLLAQQKEERDKSLETKQASREGYRGEGRDFLAANGTKEGVVTLPSGVQYEVIAEGRGASPGPRDVVTVRYSGTLVDGTAFGSSGPGDETADLGVEAVIKGLAEALQLMKEGARWRVFIPSDLAFGERGPLADRVVIYDVELVAVKPGAEAP